MFQIRGLNKRGQGFTPATVIVAILVVLVLGGVIIIGIYRGGSAIATTTGILAPSQLTAALGSCIIVSNLEIAGSIDFCKFKEIKETGWVNCEHPQIKSALEKSVKKGDLDALLECDKDSEKAKCREIADPKVHVNRKLCSEILAEKDDEGTETVIVITDVAFRTTDDAEGEYEITATVTKDGEPGSEIELTITASNIVGDETFTETTDEEGKAVFDVDDLEPNKNVELKVALKTDSTISRPLVIAARTPLD